MPERTFQKAKKYDCCQSWLRRHIMPLAMKAHHAPKNVLWVRRQQEIRDRTLEGQYHRMAALNLLDATVIHRNTGRLDEVVVERTDANLCGTKPTMSGVLFKTPSKTGRIKSVRKRCHISPRGRFLPHSKVSLDETAL
ncbi:Tn3 family transposase [Primorskyibacter flagellatus]|uniref:Tn3 transposase DDE domain-containing protein n=1 Tax=Primorskyibacter flagellatus TaxID=1387277 RepID=A0A1W2CAC5_9RHOB|nr:Tn3 transposase DDE domain-containing protein [Primorskyibacter flagellatus]